MKSRASFYTAALLCALGCGAVRPAAPTPTGVTVQRDVVYVHRPDQNLLADVYAPAGEGPFPAVLVVHGGSWRRGNKERMSAIAEQLARRGYVAVNINYRLAPAHQFPAQLYDCQAAVRWMRANAARFDIDPSRIGGFGYSAGAHLVALLATTDVNDGLDEVAGAPVASDRLQAAVIGAAPIDLRLFRANWTFDRFLGGSCDERPELYALASPITFVTSDDPPMFAYHGVDDWMVDVSQSMLMVDALHSAGVPTGFYQTERGHMTTFLVDDGQVSHSIDFLDQWLKASPVVAAGLKPVPTTARPNTPDTYSAPSSTKIGDDQARSSMLDKQSSSCGVR